MVEITDVEKNGYAARARITFQPQEIRNPTGKNDLIFNLTLSSGAKEHVAFCGIIDLDGDGRPDNEQFVRILENNNLEVDAYLDLKTGEVKKRGDGITIRTKFLIVGTDAPMVGNVKKMVEEAKGWRATDRRPGYSCLIGSSRRRTRRHRPIRQWN